MIAIMIGLLINGYSVKSQTFIPATTQDEVITGGVINTINTVSDGVYRIYDAAGKLVVSAKFSRGNTRVNTADLISGIYMVEIITTEKTVREQLFVK
jgi:hypothetical protein